MEPDGQQQGPRALPGVAYTHGWCQTVVPVGAFVFLFVCIRKPLLFCSASGVIKQSCFVSLGVLLIFMHRAPCTCPKDCLLFAVLIEVLTSAHLFLYSA